MPPRTPSGTDATARDPDAQDGAIEPGTVFARYLIVRPIGVGGMGAVYEAVHLDLEKRVALKILHDDVAHGAVARKRFHQEGRAAALVRHPHVVDVFDYGVHQGVAYLVMEYLEGETLADLLGREGALPPARIVDLLLPALAGVAAAHARGILHRDLKPENIFLAASHQGLVQPKVLDFGVSKLPPGGTALVGVTHPSVLVGTPAYMAPEQIRGDPVPDARSDQYAFGVMLYECATGRRPFAQATVFDLLEAVVRGPLEPPRALCPTLPAAFEAVVLRALARDPGDRFPAVQQLGHALLPFAGEAVRLTWGAVFGAAPPAPRDPDVGRHEPSRLPPVVSPPFLRKTTTLSESVRTIETPVRTIPAPGRWRGAGLVGLVAALTALTGVAVTTRWGRAPPPHAARALAVNGCPSAPVPGADPAVLAPRCPPAARGDAVGRAASLAAPRGAAAGPLPDGQAGRDAGPGGRTADRRGARRPAPPPESSPPPRARPRGPNGSIILY